MCTLDSKENKSIPYGFVFPKVFEFTLWKVGFSVVQSHMKQLKGHCPFMQTNSKQSAENDRKVPTNTVPKCVLFLHELSKSLKTILA